MSAGLASRHASVVSRLNAFDPWIHTRASLPSDRALIRIVVVAHDARFNAAGVNRTDLEWLRIGRAPRQSSPGGIPRPIALVQDATERRLAVLIQRLCR